MKITFCKTADEARTALAAGAIPMECSFGTEGSIVDERLCMDHHGVLSHLEGVALRAYRDHFGALREEFKSGQAHFAVTGAADADACFAIASLIGVLPHPSREAEFEKAPPHVKETALQDLLPLAVLVNRVDCNPIGIRQEETPDGCILLLWNQMASGTQDSTAFHAGVDRWRSILTRKPEALLAAVKAEEALRVAKAREAKVERVSDVVSFVESEVWGFDVWYAEHTPCIVSQTASGNVTIGCANDESAIEIFGPGGLKTVFPHLEPTGWGGRESIGGSPRSVVLTREQALTAAHKVASLVVSKA